MAADAPADRLDERVAGRFIAGPAGEIDWSAPDEELMSFHNARTREIGVQLCGRGLYQNMLPWETAGATRADPRDREFAAIWTAIPKVVFSTTMDQVQGRARLASGDVASEVARVTAEPGPGVVPAGGAGLAATLMRLDLVDEYRQFVHPVVLGGGTPYFPPLPGQLSLELLETRTFGARVAYLRYRRIRPAA
jgi:dihydrofolate reductase